MGVDVESTGISNSGAADSPKRDLRAGDAYTPQQETIDKVVNGHMEDNLWTKMGDEVRYVLHITTVSKDHTKGLTLT